MVAAAIAVVLGTGMTASPLALAIPLYVPAGPAGPCCLPNAPLLPLVPIAAGTVLALLTSRGSLGARIATGVALGIAGAMYAGLVRALVMSWANAYITVPYRFYAFIFVAAITFAIVLWAWSSLRLAVAQHLAPFALATVGVAIVFALARSEWVALGPAAAMGAAVMTGVAAERDRRVRTAIDRARHLVTTPAVMLAGLLIAAFVLRAVFGLQTLARSGPGLAFALNSDDGDYYWKAASALAANGALLLETIRTPAFPPAYTLMLSGILAVSGGRLEPVVIAQAALGVVLVGSVYAIARTVLPLGVALFAAFLVAFDSNLIQNGSTITAEALLMPAMFLAIAAMLRYRASRQGRWFAVALAALGLAFITRNVAAMPLMVAVVIWLAIWLRARPLRLARDVALVAMAALVFSAPIAIATFVIEGKPRLTTQVAELAFNFVGGEMTISNEFLLKRGIRPFNDPAQSLQRIVEDPVPVVGFLVGSIPQRIGTLLYFQAPGSSDPLMLLNAVSYPNAWGDLSTLARFAALVLITVLVIARGALRSHPTVILCGLFCLLYLAIFLFVFAPYHAFRYRIPIEPLRFIAEAAGLALIARYALRPATETPAVD